MPNPLCRKIQNTIDIKPQLPAPTGNDQHRYRIHPAIAQELISVLHDKPIPKQDTSLKEMAETMISF